MCECGGHCARSALVPAARGCLEAARVAGGVQIAADTRKWLRAGGPDTRSVQTGPRTGTGLVSCMWSSQAIGLVSVGETRARRVRVEGLLGASTTPTSITGSDGIAGWSGESTSEGSWSQEDAAQRYGSGSGSLGAMRRCFEPHATGKCVSCHGGDKPCLTGPDKWLASTAGWRFYIRGGMSSLKHLLPNLFIRSDIVAQLTWFDYRNVVQGSMTHVVPPEYWQVRNNGWAYDEDCNFFPIVFKDYDQCRLDVSATIQLSLYVMKLQEGFKLSGLPEFFQGPGGAQTVTGNPPGTDYPSPTTEYRVRTKKGWRPFASDGDMEETKVDGYKGQLQYQMTNPHCAAAPLAMRPPTLTLPPDGGGGTPTPPGSGGGTPTLSH